MSRKFIFLALFSSLAFGLPIRREVPQEHSHEKFLTAVNTFLKVDNPDGILDAVFGLLGNAAAATGAGNIADPTCLQQATADRAFTNAKAAGSIDGQVAALIYRALEKNTLQVGLTSEPCTSIQAVNPEIAAIQQHQDPASPNAAAINKAITLELAKQIASVGGNPADALLAGTFSPGDLNDPTARGNSCNEIDDPEGCIFTQNLLVPDASEDEIAAAVAGVEVEEPAATETAAETATETAAETATETAAGTETCAPQQTVTVTVDAGAAAPTVTEVVEIVKVVRGKKVIVQTRTRTAEVTATATETASATSEEVAAPTSTSEVTEGNLQTFSGTLGGEAAPAVIQGGRGFQVEGNASFLNLRNALARSCDVQKNRCANVANSAAGREQGLSVGDCEDQKKECDAANA